MDALVYEDTPIASYFEGEAIPYDQPREQTPPPTPFAPKGLPDFKRRLRKIRRSASSIAPGSAYTEELLERFRYIIVASQLLSDELGPRPSLPDHDQSESDITTLRGAAATAVTSFLAAWAIHWLRNRKQNPRSLTWVEVGAYVAGVVVIAVVSVLIGRRIYTNYLQRASVRTLSRYVNDSSSLDLTTNNVMRFIQEVEVVARGYGLGSSLPPASRLEDRQIIRRCQTLRRELAAALKMLTIVMVESHNAMQPYINTTDVQRYHDIYDVSLVEYTQAIEVANSNTEEVQGSLKELRFSFKLHALARKVFLCDLMAIRQSTGWARSHQWSDILRTLREVQTMTTSKQNALSHTLSEEEWGHQKLHRRSIDSSSQSDGENALDNPTIKMQLRRFEDVTHAVRALNAKVHILKEELNSLANANSEDGVVASALSKHYESLGTDLRNLLSDWERGKSVMLQPFETEIERASCSSGSVQTPLSASPSLGSLQIIDGGPADALRLLNGDYMSSPHSNGIFEEEVFEAVASQVPRKQMSVSAMTREEKIAKLAEERKKRATLQEQAENTTSMLRELQMVIKHRPKTSLPGVSRSNSSAGANAMRVSSI